MRALGVGIYSKLVGSAGVAVLFSAAVCCLIGASSAAAHVADTILVGKHPYAVSSDGTHVWVTNSGENTVSEIEAASGAVVDTIPVGADPTGVSADGTHVWVANLGEPTVSEIDAASGVVVNTIPVGADAYGVSSDGTHVWVTHPGAETVSEIEASTGTVLAVIPVDSRPYGISADGTHVWFVNPEKDTVGEIEASSAALIRTIPVGSEPEGISSDGTDVWVTNYAEAPEGTISEIDASTGTVVNTLPGGRGPYRISSDGAHLWVTHFGESAVSEIAVSSGALIHTIKVDTQPIGVSSDGTHVWVANYGERTLSEIVPDPPGPRCNVNAAAVKLSPGLTNTAAVQTMKITGSLTGCQGEPFTAASYKATLKTAGAVTCAVLAGGGEPATGSVKFKWTPKTKPASAAGTLSMPLTAASTAVFESSEVTIGPAFEFSGEVATGAHSPLPFTGTATTRYIGGARCGQKGVKVKEGEIAKSEVGFP